MPEPIRTREQASHLLARILGSNQEYSILESEHGWVCRQILSPQEQNERGMGQGAYVINKATGVITEHSSAALPVIAAEFDRTTAAGRPPQGYQIHPPIPPEPAYPRTHRIRLTRTFEDQHRIGYQVDLTFLEHPNDPGISQQVEITKNPVTVTPSDRVSTTATAWAHQQSRATGTWPQTGVIEI
ncbi:hypothetical protein [Nocardia mangyaensis]|uniref:hypothetical protein n=1 Tax=Nocardia mangyaensis TaxID=2213200 RepID=UPI0026775792|nr:hypothetical protein [Nocardia mangyaensis]MDO3651217.1 hypothetical protein [Nocardia mangyaensis]